MRFHTLPVDFTSIAPAEAALDGLADHDYIIDEVHLLHYSVL